MPVSTLIRKKVIFSHAYRGSSRSLHGVTTHVKPPGFKQLNWRISENLSQAINNGSWYKLSILVSEDAMIVPATCIYSVWRFTQNSWDIILGDPRAVIRVDKMFVVKGYCKIETSAWVLTLTEPVPEAFELPASEIFLANQRREAAGWLSCFLTRRSFPHRSL